MGKIWKQRNNNVEYRVQKIHRSTKWEVLVTSFIINTLVPTTFCSFGIYLMCLEDVQIKVSQTIWSPTIFLTSFIISKPWCQELAEYWVDNGKKSGRWWTILGLTVAAFGISTSLFISNLLWSAILTGILGGCGISVVLEYVKSNIDDHFHLQNPLIRVVDEAAVAIGQFIIPHLTYGFIRFFSLQYAPIFQSAILIQVIPSILLLKNTRFGLPTIKSRYSDFQRPLALLTDQEMVVFSKELITPEVDIKENGSTLTSFRQWKSLPNISKHEENVNIDELNELEPDNNNIETLEEPNVDTNDNTISTEDTNSNINGSRLKNSLGVEILPEIPEENEDTCSITSGNNTYNKNLNRLSVISTRLDEMISRQDATDVYIPDNLQIVSNTSENSYKKIPESTNYSLKILSPYKTYRIKKTYRYLKRNVYDWFLKPLKQSLRLNSFYLSLSANLSLYISWFSFLCFVPIFTKLIDTSILELHEPVFIISIAAFIWIVFLIITPWIVELPKRHLKLIFILGTVIKAIAFFVLAISSNHETITFASMIFGFGFGATSFTLNIVNKECLGVRNWPLLKKSLYTFTGIIIIMFIHAVRLQLNDLNGLIFYFKLICYYEVFVAVYWTICHMITMTNSFNSRWNSLESMYN